MRTTFILSFVSLLAAACYTPPHEDSGGDANTGAIHISAQPQEQVEFPRMEFVGGAVVTSEIQLEQELAVRYRHGFTETRATFADAPSSGCSNGRCWGELHQPIFDSKYSFVLLGMHDGNVGGCIKRYIKHVSIILRKAGVKKPIIDIHVAHWREDGKYCYGIYVSPQGWSKCPCFNDPSNWSGPKAAQAYANEIKETLREALEASGLFMKQQAAAITAAGLAPIIWWALPIPPPPL